MGLINERYIDEGQQRGQNDVPLRDFLAQRNRAQWSTGRGVPLCSGPEREIPTFRQMANAWLLDRQGNAALVAEDPPGAGKSALVAQCQVENGGDRERAIVRRSANWPQQLAVCLNAALRTLKRHLGAPRGFGKADPARLPEAAALRDEGRNSHYDRRVRGLDRHNARHSRSGRHLGPLLSEGGGEAHLDDVVGYLAGAPPNLPPGEVDGSISARQRDGIGERLPGSRLRAPNPSFAAPQLGEPLLPEAASPGAKQVNFPCRN